MAPSSAKQRRSKKGAEDEDSTEVQAAPQSARERRQQKTRQRAWLIGGPVLVSILAFFGYDSWKQGTRDAEETARTLACAWEKCADPASNTLLQTMADMASKQVGNIGQELSPQRAMWSYCLKVCMDAPDHQASEAAVQQVAPVLSSAAAQAQACAKEPDWTIDISTSASREDALLNAVESASDILMRCGLVRLKGLWEEADFPWMEQALAHYKALSAESISAWGRIEPRPRPTEDVLVPLPDAGFGVSAKFAEGFWETGIARFMSHPTIAGTVAAHFNATGAPRLSYVSWIVAPSIKKDVKLQPQKMHSDADTPKSMVSAHLALEDVTADMGPTGYCPGTHIPGQGSSTEPAGLAGPLELHFALRYIALTKGTQSCTPIVPSTTRRGTVTIYDSALVHRGEANRASRPRILLNLNIAAGASAIDHENYFAYFKDKPSKRVVQKHLSWLRQAFGVDYYEELLQSGTTDREVHGKALAVRRFKMTELS